MDFDQTVKTREVLGKGWSLACSVLLLSLVYFEHATVHQQRKAGILRVPRDSMIRLLGWPGIQVCCWCIRGVKPDRLMPLVVSRDISHCNELQPLYFLPA